MPSLYVAELAFLIGLKTLLCSLAYARKIGNRLPYFFVFTILLLANSVFQALMMWQFGYHSAVYYYSAWISSAVVIIARSGAVAELCWNCLRTYPGIWTLAWRFFALMALVLLAHAAWDTSGQPHWITAYVLTLDRDIEISTFLILAAMLWTSHYYRIGLERFQQWVAIGICFYCITAFANSTILRDLFTANFPTWLAMLPRMNQLNDISDLVDVAATGLTLGTWCFLLRHPLPEPAPEPALLPAEVYAEMSPAINLQLRELNERIVEMLRS